MEPALAFSSSVQASVISLNLETTLVNMLLLGIYTVVYFATLYIYVTKKSSKNWGIVTAITILYLVYVGQTAVSWFITKQAFLNHGQTQETIFVAVFLSPLWGTFVADICYYLMAQIADGLLIWRCFIIWDRSFRVISLSLFLLFSEIAVNWSIIILAAVAHLNPSPSQAKILNRLTGTLGFITLAATLVTTLLISYRIHSVANQEIARGIRARFKNIVEIFIQSAALYVLVTLANAVASIISYPATNFVPLLGAQDYTALFFVFTAGFSPTVMVARVAYSSGPEMNNTAITHISGLQFRGQSNISQGSADSRYIESGETPVMEVTKEKSDKEDPILVVV